MELISIGKYFSNFYTLMSIILIVFGIITFISGVYVFVEYYGDLRENKVEITTIIIMIIICLIPSTYLVRYNPPNEYDYLVNDTEKLELMLDDYRITYVDGKIYTLIKK